MRLFFFFNSEREKTGVVLAVYKTPYNLLTGVPRIKKTTVLLSFETSYLSHWFRSNYKGRVGNYTIKLVFFFSFRVRKESRFPFLDLETNGIETYFSLYFVLVHFFNLWVLGGRFSCFLDMIQVKFIFFTVVPSEKLSLVCFLETQC